VTDPRLRVLIDDQAFVRHGRSGISRYFTELVRALGTDRELGVDPVTPYRYVANAHLPEALPGRYHRVLLPPPARTPVLRALNARARSRSVRDSVDLVHHTLHATDALAVRPGTRRVTTVYDFIYELHPELFPDAGLAIEEQNRFLAACDGLLCISQATADDLRRLHPEVDVPVAVTPLGVSERFLAAESTSLAGLPERYVLFVGNREKHKNVGLLLAAFAALTETHPDLQLVLCGNGLKPEEQEQLDRLGISSRTICRRVNDAELPTLYREAAAFVFPSRYEGFGLPVVEAMAAGCPVLVAETPAVLEVAEGAAEVFSPDDVDGLVSLLERVLGDGVLRERMRAAGQARARDLSWHDTAMRTAAAYRQLLTA
jgi:glycosyltransferase involved in cell wall biosynthesis